MKIFQIVMGKCHWQTPFKSLDETANFPPDCIFVEAPDYVNEQWGFDETEVGDARFIPPTAPEGFVYDEETGKIVEESALAQMLEESKNNKQNENNRNLSDYLDKHPLTWIDGKKYGITKEDQNEITMNLLSYTTAKEAGVENPVLEWHAINEACVPWEYEKLVALSIDIREAVYPWYSLNQKYKEKIFACDVIKSVDEIELNYNKKALLENGVDASKVADDESVEDQTEKSEN